MSILVEAELVTAPTLEPVTVAEVKKQCNVTHSDDDALLSELIVSAREMVENDIPGGKQLLTATHELTLPCFPAGGIELPKPPLKTIVSLKYYDTSEVQQTMDASDYYVVTHANKPGAVYPSPGTVWPLTGERRDAVRVRFTCGEATAAQVPSRAKRAILMLASHWYENREATGDVSREIEIGYRALVNSLGCGIGFAG